MPVRPPRRRRLAAAFASLWLVGAAAASTGCARKSGCPVNEAAHAEANKEGKFKKTKSKSELFPRDMRARMKKG